MASNLAGDENSFTVNSSSVDAVSPFIHSPKRLSESPVTVVNRSIARRTSSRHSNPLEYSEDSDEDKQLGKDVSLKSLVVPSLAGSSSAEPQWAATTAPIQLVRGSNGVFELTQQGQEFLNMNVGERKVVVITVCGLYRTGKSYLLNLISGRFGNEGPLFVSSSAVSACTAGIWIWGSVPQGEDEPVYLLVDCEGSGNTANSRDHDSRLFAIAMLMSSYFILNSKGVIDDSSLSHLALVAALANTSIAKSATAVMQRSKPKFMWVLRDFVLALESLAGSPISASEYLENSLQGKSYKKALLSMFSYLDCTTLVTPILEEAKLHRLAELDWFSLRKDFRDQIESLRFKIFREARKKRSFLGDSDLSGIQLCLLIENAVSTINSNQVPRIDSLYQQVQKEDQVRQMNQLMLEFEIQSTALALPLHPAHLEDELRALRKGILKKCHTQESKNDAIFWISAQSETVIARNDEKTKEKGEQLLRLLWKEEVVGVTKKSILREKINKIHQIFFEKAVGDPELLKQVYEDNVIPRTEKLLLELKDEAEESSRMSVVREILGVSQQTVPSPMATVLSSLGAAPKAKLGRKRKSSKFEKRELANLRDSDTLVTSPPLTPVSGDSRWQWKKFKNSASFSGDPFLLFHWDNRPDSDQDYSAVRCNVKVEMPEPEFFPQNEESVLLQKVLRETELNFIVAADKLGTTAQRVKQVYYAAFARAFPNRKCKYSYDNDMERKEALEQRQGEEKGAEWKKREKQLNVEIKDLEKKIKEFNADSSFLQRLVAPPSHTEPSSNQDKISLASAEKKPAGYELIYKFLPGLAGPASKETSPQTLLVNKLPVDFSAISRLPEGCTSFNSRKIMKFFHELNDMHEAEKNLTAFIKKRELEIKTLKKNSSS